MEVENIGPSGYGSHRANHGTCGISPNAGIPWQLDSHRMDGSWLTFVSGEYLDAEGRAEGRFSAGPLSLLMLPTWDATRANTGLIICTCRPILKLLDPLRYLTFQRITGVRQ